MKGKKTKEINWIGKSATATGPPFDRKWFIKIQTSWYRKLQMLLSHNQAFHHPANFTNLSGIFDLSKWVMLRG
jgi:hypothetical protein